MTKEERIRLKYPILSDEAILHFKILTILAMINEHGFYYDSDVIERAEELKDLGKKVKKNLEDNYPELEWINNTKMKNLINFFKKYFSKDITRSFYNTFSYVFDKELENQKIMFFINRRKWFRKEQGKAKWKYQR